MPTVTLLFIFFQVTAPCQSNLITLPCSEITDPNCLELLPWQCLYEDCFRENRLDAWDVFHRHADAMAPGVETESRLICKPVGL